MKLFAVAVLVVCGQLAVVLAGSDEMMKSCLGETKAEAEDIIRFSQGGEATENVKCFFKCMMLGHGGLTADGQLLLEPMKPYFPADKMHIAEECVKIEQGGELCDLAYRHHLCIREKDAAWYRSLFDKKST